LLQTPRQLAPDEGVVRGQGRRQAGGREGVGAPASGGREGECGLGRGRHWWAEARERGRAGGGQTCCGGGEGAAGCACNGTGGRVATAKLPGPVFDECPRIPHSANFFFLFCFCAIFLKNPFSMQIPF